MIRALREQGAEKKVSVVGVTDNAGRLVGLVTTENVGEMMMVQAAREARTDRSGPRGRRGAPFERTAGL
jgi:hypothetical protein